MPDSRDITQRSRYSRPGTQCPSPATHDTPGVRARQALDISSPIYPCIRAAILAADPACNRRRAAACAFAAGESMNVPRRLQPLEFGKLRCATPRRSVHLHACALGCSRRYDAGNPHRVKLQTFRGDMIPDLLENGDEAWIATQCVIRALTLQAIPPNGSETAIEGLAQCFDRGIGFAQQRQRLWARWPRTTSSRREPALRALWRAARRATAAVRASHRRWTAESQPAPRRQTCRASESPIVGSP